MMRANISPMLIGLLALGGCAAEPPVGPQVIALPAKSKDLAQFQSEDNTCRGYAQQQIGFGQTQGVATQSAVGSAAVGTGDAATSAAAQQRRYDVAYTQCMMADGNQVQTPPSGWYYGPYAYAPYYGPWPWYGSAATLEFFGEFRPHFHHPHAEHHAFHGGMGRG